MGKQYIGLIALLKEPQQIANRLLYEDPEAYRKAIIDFWHERQAEKDNDAD